jgi:hypothetical protein
MARVGSLVVIQNLVGKPQYNGRQGTVCSAESVLTGRTTIKLEAEEVAVKKANMRLIDTTEFERGSSISVTRVRIRDLVNSAQYNGATGTIAEKFEDGKIRVALMQGRRCKVNHPSPADGAVAMSSSHLTLLQELRVKDANVEVLGIAQGRLSTKPASDTWNIQLADGEELVVVKDCVTFESLRPPDVSIPEVLACSRITVRVLLQLSS